MNYLVLVGAIFPMLILTAPSHQVFAYRDPKHCNGDSCYAIGYNDEYNDAKKESALPTRVLVIVHVGAMDIMMDFALGTGVVIFSMDKGVTKVPT